jgi:quinol monooxygenase YgiN
MAAVIRIFRATVKPGKAEEFHAFFLDQALPLVKSQDGLLSATVGLPTSSNPGEFLMVTVWENIESIKKFAGENWERPVIDPREAHLLSVTAVNHYYRAEGPA